MKRQSQYLFMGCALLATLVILPLHTQAQGFQPREGGPFSLVFLADGSMSEVEFKDGMLQFVSISTPPKATRSQYAVDVKVGDHVTAVNNQSVRTLEDFDKVFDPIASGETVTLALVRASQRHTVSFKKPTDEEIAEGGFHIMRGLPGGASFISDGGEATPADGNDFMFVSDDTPATALQDDSIFDLAGHIMEMDGDVLKVRIKLQHPQGEAIALEPEDEILKINGEAILSLNEMRILYGIIDVGASVELEIRRAGNTETVSFAKPDTP